MTTITKGQEAYEPTVQYADPLFSWEAAKATNKSGKMFISPFGVLLGKNLSGDKRGEQVLTDKPFMNSVGRLGIHVPAIVRRVEYEGKHVYLIVAGNRRAFALRHLIGSGVLAAEEPRALLPIYEMNELELENVSPENAANLIENGMKRNLDHISKARLLEELITGGAGVDELSLLVMGKNGKPLNKETIRQYRQLLKLHPKVQDAVRDNVMQVAKAANWTEIPHEEQLQMLDEILEAQGMSKNKAKAAQEVINKHKAKHRKDKDGESIFDPPRAPAVIRSTVRKLASVSAWSALPKAQKLTPEGYTAVAELFGDLEQWLDGALTPRKYQPEDVALTLQTRILAIMARFTKKT